MQILAYLILWKLVFKIFLKIAEHNMIHLETVSPPPPKKKKLRLRLSVQANFKLAKKIYGNAFLH